MMRMGHLPSQALGEEPVLAGAATSPVDAAGTGAPLIGGAPASDPGAGASLGMPWNNTRYLIVCLYPSVVIIIKGHILQVCKQSVLTVSRYSTALSGLLKLALSAATTCSLS